MIGYGILCGSSTNASMITDTLVSLELVHITAGRSPNSKLAYSAECLSKIWGSIFDTK